jgi:hypothetical protein
MNKPSNLIEIPVFAETDPRNEFFVVRFTHKEKQFVEKLAKSRKIKMSAMIRQIIYQWIEDHDGGL